jgi:tetratricopeptide (TPR) repeat protein
MARRLTGRHLGILFGMVAIVAIALPAAAQNMAQGSVTDSSGKPVEGAKITIEQEGTNRHYDSKTDKKGEFIQIGLQSGDYKVTAEKDKLSAVQQIHVGGGKATSVKLVLGAAEAAAGNSAATALKKTIDEAMAAQNGGRLDDAIAGFEKALTLQPTCSGCYYNIGFIHAQKAAKAEGDAKKKEFADAETAYKKAIEVKADYADAYSGLASIYNAQRRFDDAATASAKATELAGTLPSGGAAGAGGGGNADALYNQGVILWNGGKIPEAKKAFEGAIQANPNHAEAHYQLGMALVNEGNLPAAATEFETYLKLSPDGPNAATAKGLVAQLKK